jgi:hypothetical protein
VRRQIEREEEDRVSERTAGDPCLVGDVDAGEADAGEDPDRDEVDELAIA